MGGIGQQGREQTFREKKKREKEKKKKGNTLNKLLPLLWSGNRGRGTALPSALNKHCGPTTTYKAGLDVSACRLEGRGVSRGWGRERNPSDCAALHKTPGESRKTPAKLKQAVPPPAAAAQRSERRSVSAVSVGKMRDFVSVRGADRRFRHLPAVKLTLLSKVRPHVKPSHPRFRKTNEYF